MAVSASTSSFSFNNGSYDVFLSFRGQDTRQGFTGFLYKTLCDRGIHTFIDDEELQKGDQITPSLVEAIQSSKIAIVVLSKNYAFSLFCLDELVHIIDCSKEKGALVLPVFYNVDPSDVRHLKGSYGEALDKHEKKYKVNMERLEKWKTALKQVADLSGWPFKDGDGYEYKFIEEIVEAVSDKINRGPLHVANYPVGLESRVSQVNSLLYDGSDDGVCMVGIYGIGGIGKTTVARAVYNLIANQFEGFCFLEDMRKKSITDLQETLLSEIVGEKGKLRSVNQGIPIVNKRFRQKKVLLVLDDVDKLEQLLAIVGEPNWFGVGSKIIITTRDKQLLMNHGVKRTYEVEGLNKKEALALLSWNAFKTDKVDSNYMDILTEVVTYASGLPLALEVIGSNMFGRRIKEWKSALNQYKRIPNKGIQEILKISFDSLNEFEQEIFLDIACCFKGYAKAYVKEILHAHHGVCSKDRLIKDSLKVLCEKSLIKTVNCHLTMHDLIEDMGKDIVRQESLKEPGKRSRLWFHEDIVQVLEENTGTSRIEIIIIDFIEDEVNWDGEGFKNMTSLKTLIIKDGLFSKGPKCLPNSLRVLEWWTCPSLSLPSDFYPKKLVILKLPYSCSMSLEWLMSKKKFMNLSVLNFDGCQWIKKLPNVSGVPKLEKLSLRECGNLVEIHESVGFLDELRILDVFFCKKLRTFPPIKLTSLEQLELSKCTSLECFPEILGKMENIKHLYFQGTGIKKLPASITYLTQLQWLGVSSHQMLCLPLSIDMLPALQQLVVWGCEGLQLCKDDDGEEKESSMSSLHLEYLDLISCNISHEILEIGLWFANVKCLDLSYNNFTILPKCIQDCCHLRELKLDYCKRLVKTNGIPPNLETFSAEGCSSLIHLDLTVLPAWTKECNLRKVILDGDRKLKKIKGILSTIKLLSAIDCESLTSSCRSMLLNQELHDRDGSREFLLPARWIPEWFEYCSMGPSISFRFRNKFPTISICIFVAGNQGVEFSRSYLLIKVNEVNKKFVMIKENLSWLEPTVDTIYILDKKRIIFEDGESDVFSENEWNHVEVEFPIFRVEVGIHVVRQESCMEDIQFTNIYERIPQVHENAPVNESSKGIGQLLKFDPPIASRNMESDDANVDGSEPDEIGSSCSSNEETQMMISEEEGSIRFLKDVYIQKLRSQSILIFDHCESITEIPDVSAVPILEEFHHLRELILDGCNLLREVKGIPPNLEVFSARCCTSLMILDLTTCTEECHLRELILDYCNLLWEVKGIPPNLEVFSARGCTSLMILDLTTCTKECHLRELILDDCNILRQVKGFPPNLEVFSARGCTSLIILDLTTCTKECHLRKLILDDCNRLWQVKGIPPNLEVFSATGCTSLIILDLPTCTVECHF